MRWRPLVRADRLVAAQRGDQAIGSLQVGDTVLAYKPVTGKSKPELVQHLWRNHDHDLVDVQLTTTTQSGDTDGSASGASATSGLHPWVRRGALAVGLTVGLAATLLTTSTTGGATAQANAAVATASTAIRAMTQATSSETIHTTANHPWLTADRGWEVAGDLRPGEPVQLLDGGTAQVVALRIVPGEGPMWDLSLDATHTFAVGASQAVVHNDNCTETWGQVKQLSNGQTLAQFRSDASQCDFCGQSFQPGQARIIEHAYPRDAARPQFTSQAEYNSFVADVDNLSVVCRSCNSIKGTKYPGDFRVLFEGRPSFQGGDYVQRLLAKIVTTAQRYGLRNPW